MASSPARALTYAAAQTARVAFYGAHYLAARMVARDAFADVEKPAHPIPSLAQMLASMRALFAQDWKNVEAGLYPVPLDVLSELRRATASVRFLSDIPRVAERRRRGGHGEVRDRDARLPRYFRQNFHFQTGGYLSEESARLYDFQVEALFAGTADAMRRRAYVPIAKFLDGRSSRASLLLDIGAGTGRFLSFVKSVRPKLRVTALDLSQPYLDRARRALSKHDGVDFIAAPAEAMPLPDKSVDAAVSIFLFHELPPKVRAAAAKEIARVLKPGGIFVLAETIQYGDAPEFDGLIELFPSLLHEPYYSSYTKTDLDDLFGAAGLKRTATDIAYLTKIAVFEKPKRARHRATAANSRSRVL
ncbi:MAG TPA: class I SAM-dependent methyltransferase [Rhizomicrobium sp.]|jgi:ubiquinone/menaquinone biosynthesis C-methylase UbiE